MKNNLKKVTDFAKKNVIKASTFAAENIEVAMEKAKHIPDAINGTTEMHRDFNDNVTKDNETVKEEINNAINGHNLTVEQLGELLKGESSKPKEEQNQYLIESLLKQIDAETSKSDKIIKDEQDRQVDIEKLRAKLAGMGMMSLAVLVGGLSVAANLAGFNIRSKN